MTSIAGRRWRAFGVILSALGAVAPDVGLAQGQHQNANLYAFYDWTGGPFAQNLEQETLIKQKAAASY